MAVKIVFFDCDGTLTRVKSSWEYLHRRLKLWDNHADEFQLLFRAGLIDYEEFCRRDASLWKGLKIENVMEIVNEIPYNDGVQRAMETIRTLNVFTVILSTGLSFLVERVRAELRIDMAMSNSILLEGNVLTGEIRINVEHDHKDRWVERILRQKGLRREEAAAVGDGEGDKGMFESVDVAIGYQPSEGVMPLIRHAVHDSFEGVAEVLKYYL